jgi:hypothetical protein
MSATTRTDVPARMSCVHWRQHYRPRKERAPRWMRRLWLWF